MDDEERQKLAEKLDRELDEYIQEKIANSKAQRKVDEDEKDIDELIAEMKQHPAFLSEFDETKPLSAAMQGLQALKYEGDSAEDNAMSFKEDGNRNFQKKKYRWAIDNYTEGIKCRCKSKELNAVLHSNRAASHSHIGNYRSAFNDSILARKFKPDHLKAILRGSLCCMELKKYEDAVKWCDDGLMLNPKDEKFLECRQKADKLARQQERDKRKELAKKRKDQIEHEKLLETIKSRGVTLAPIQKKDNDSDQDPLMLSSLESSHPSGSKVKLDEKGDLHWPVLFLYPEHAESDFIESFCEHSRFIEHLQYMFGECVDRPPWDSEKKYTPDKIEVYYEDKDKKSLVKVPKESTLLSVLESKRFVVQVGTPAFVLLVTGSKFCKSFLAKYNL